MPYPLITLLTDFGAADVYVGVMKGVIASINPALRTIDLTHAIPPQNIALASFQLSNAYLYFPTNTVHVVVVDPGVGTHRRAIACQTHVGVFVAPDNGVLSAVLCQTPPQIVIELTNSQYWRTDTPSTTFHGRDIFAPAAAHLATGVPLTQLGVPLEPQQLVCLAPQPYQTAGPDLLGTIQAIDHFGNLITNIPGSVLPSNWTIDVKGQQIPSHTAYGDAQVGELLSLIGSHGWLEIAVNGESAQAHLHSQVGDRIQLILD